MRKLLNLCMFSILVCVWPALWAQSQSEARLTGWSYRTDSRYLAPDYEDKTGRMLADGDLKGLVIYATAGTVIEIELPTPAYLTRAVIHATRPNFNYKLRAVRVQANEFGHWRDVGEAAGFWGPTTERTFRLEIPTLNVTTDKLRLVFANPSVLSLSEIELFGQAVTQQASSSYALPFVNDPQPSAREQDVDQDGKPELILENEYVRLIFTPLTGGVCRSLVYKPVRQEFVCAQDPRYGALRDQLWAPPYMFAERPYSWRLSRDANTAWIELSVTGSGGMMSFTTLTKRIEITRGSPVISVHYRLLNEPSSMTDYTYGFWVHNFWGPVGSNMRYFSPTDEGVQELAYPQPAGEKKADYWYRTPARGWTAVCGEQGQGLAAKMEYKYLNCFYNWAGVGYATATQEWRYNRLPLKSGQAFETDVRLIPFSGLTRVDGVIEDIIGAIDIQGKAAHIKLVPASPKASAATGLIRLRQWPEGEWRELGKIEMPGGRPAEQTVNMGDLAPGGYVLNVQIIRSGKLLDDFERPFAIGGAQFAYRRAPREPRMGLKEEEKVGLPRHELSDEIITPHVKWANPLPGGPIKAVVLCDDFVAREIIELKQRLQLDVTYVKFRTTFWTEELWCGDRSISTPAQANKRLRDYLQNNQYELFLISGFHWQKHFEPETREAIRKQVKAGAGLILIEPDGFTEDDELAPIAGLARTRQMGAFSKWHRAEASPLTAGLPWDMLPATRYMEYSQPPQGRVLATLDKGQPLLVINELGQGRTAVLTYDTLTHELSYRGYAGLIPIFSYRGGFLREEYSRMTWRYWEPYYALLARLAVWAAKRDTGVDVVSLEPLLQHEFGEQTVLPLRLSGGTGEYLVTVDFENRWGQPVEQVRTTYTAGQPQIDIPVPPYLPAGLNFVNVIVKDKTGAHVAWAQTYVMGTTPVSIQSITPEKRTIFGTRPPRTSQLYERAFSPSEPLRLRTTLAVKEPVPAGYKVQARLWDTHRRLLFEQTRPVGDGNDMLFEAQPPELRSQGLEWEIVVLGPYGQTDSAKSRVLCVAPRDWERFRLTSWGGIFPWRSEYLFDALAPRVEALVDVSFSGTTENNTGKTWLELWHNIGYSHLGLLGYMGPGVADFMDNKFAEKSTKYAQTKDKQYLIREPSLADREWRAKVMEHMRRAAQEDKQWGSPYDYCMGDEMSLTHYTRYFDYDFDPRNLADFREWLKKRYRSLAELNAAWETSYASWEDVMPLTLEEARQRSNAAPWAEFRIFMNDSLANFFADIRQALGSVDPEVRAGLSGTQEPRAGNGMDWWKLSRAFNFYHSYNTGWSNEMRRSFAPYTGVQQSPYYAGYWNAGRSLEYNMFWCLLHDTNGISAWNTAIFFYNDFTYSESGRDTLALCQEFKRGLWDLLRTGQWEHGGIAIHYSQDAINAAQLAAREEEHKEVRDAWIKLLEDMGLQYNFVSTEQIEAGLLTQPRNDFERYKVLILPESLAITEKERAAIEAFVRAGGTVIGDFNIGLYDGLCRKQATGMLDSLFGIKREGQPDMALHLDVKLPGAEAQGVKLAVAEGLVSAGAKSYAVSSSDKQSPAVFINTVGKGLACYLNLDLRPYEDERTFQTPGEKQIQALLKAILAKAGVKPVCDISLASGRAPHIEVTRHRAGDLQFLGFLHSGGDKEEITSIKLPSTSYVYDCRTGESLGQRSQIRTTFASRAALVYCLSPAPLAAPNISLRSPLARPGETVTYTVSLKNGQERRQQVVHLTVLTPDGLEYRDYARNILLGSKPFTGSFRLALNDPPGRWRLIVRDVASGQTAQAECIVQ